MLQLKLKCKGKIWILYLVNTRELHGVPNTKYLLYIHLANSPCYIKSSLL